MDRREVVLRYGEKFSGVKVFSATMHRDRAQLGETMTRWISDHPDIAIVSIVMTQSSDSDYHCLSAVVFYRT